VLVHSAREARIIAAGSGKDWKLLGCRGFELLIMGAAVPRFQPGFSSPSTALMHRGGKREKPQRHGPGLAGRQCS